MLRIPYAVRVLSLLPARQVAVISVLVTLSFSCHKSLPVEPPPAGLDTTSHAFVWTTTYVGDVSTFLFDVAIVNDTLAYAVGDIHGWDSLKNGYDANLVRWDGENWHMEKVTILFRGNYFAPELYGICAFAPDDIWLTGGDPIHGNGRTWTDYDIRGILRFDTIAVTHIWGTSSKDLFFAGDYGSLVRFDGTTWELMPPPSRAWLKDIYGSPDGSVLWASSYDDQYGGTWLFRYLRSEGVWRLVYDGTAAEWIVRADSLSGTYTSVYAPSAQTAFVSSPAGLYRIDNAGSHLPRAQRLSFSPDYFPGLPNRVRGNNQNDVFLAGYRGFLAHYNGSSWHEYEELRSTDHLYTSIAVRGNLVIAVGMTYDPIYSKGVISIGRRTP